MSDIYRKKQILDHYLRELGSVAVAFSSGADSTFLLKTAHDLLGDRAIAVTARALSFPDREWREADAFCRSENITHLFVDFDIFSVAGFRENPANRCYLCKRELFAKIIAAAGEHGIAHVIEGSNMDDTGDYRPGLTAITELGVQSPLRYAGLTKAEIRRLLKEAGLATWEKPSFACLASRFVYGEAITEEKLIMVDRAEQFLLDLGFHQVRVRIHQKMARIEILPEEFPKILAEENALRIHEHLYRLGFTYVALDLGGYHTGSMNRDLAGP